MKDVDPDAFGHPARAAIAERFVRTVDGRGVDPAATGLQHMHDSADDPAIIHPRFAARIGRTTRLKPRELSLAQLKLIAIHPRSPFGDLGSRNPHLLSETLGDVRQVDRRQALSVTGSAAALDMPDRGECDLSHRHTIRDIWSPVVKATWDGIEGWYASAFQPCEARMHRFRRPRARWIYFVCFLVEPTKE